jgi:hypothetical protein
MPYTQTTMQCNNCGALCMRRGPGQRYCEPCSEVRDLERKKLWARKNPAGQQAVANRQIRGARSRQKGKEAGALIGATAARCIGWMDEIDLLWLVRFSVPFSYATSKNHIYASTPKGHRFMRTESRAAMDEITLRLRSELAGIKVVHNKVWLDILVQKTNHRGDAVNVIDLVCDGVKKAIPVDDRWFSIRRLDWEVVKANPRIFIGVGQEDVEDSQVCSYCGRILPFSKFGVKKHNRFGIARECKDCRKLGREIAK